jgi:hypothetical protein
MYSGTFLTRHAINVILNFTGENWQSWALQPAHLNQAGSDWSE